MKMYQRIVCSTPAQLAWRSSTGIVSKQVHGANSASPTTTCWMHLTYHEPASVAAHSHQYSQQQDARTMQALAASVLTIRVARPKSASMLSEALTTGHALCAKPVCHVTVLALEMTPTLMHPVIDWKRVLMTSGGWFRALYLRSHLARRRTRVG